MKKSHHIEDRKRSKQADPFQLIMDLLIYGTLYALILSVIFSGIRGSHDMGLELPRTLQKDPFSYRER